MSCASGGLDASLLPCTAAQCFIQPSSFLGGDLHAPSLACLAVKQNRMHIITCDLQERFHDTM